MPLASYILATHYRPHLLAAVLGRILRSEVPAGWELEVVVAANEQDEAGRAIAAQFGARVVLVESPRPGGKFTAAYKASKGSVLLMAGDDDLQSPRRLAEAIELHRTFKIVGCHEFRFLELASGKVVRWRGPAAKVGSCRSFRRSVLDAVGGWCDLPRGIDTDLQCRIEVVFGHPKSGLLSLETGLDTVCLQHGSNIWSRRKFPEKGDVINRAEFTLTGEGHYSEVDGFPVDAAEIVDRLAPIQSWYDSSRAARAAKMARPRNPREGLRSVAAKMNGIESRVSGLEQLLEQHVGMAD